MCGRYSFSPEIQQIIQRFKIDEITFEYTPRYNLAPGQMIPAIIANEGRNRLGLLKWGLIPYWAKDEKIGYKTINAKAETVHEKPAFRHAFRKKRCIIPADGFYEWKKSESGKQPMRITLKSGEPFGMAGLFDSWTSSDGTKIHTCTIITTRPNELVSEIHDRMPVILRPEDETIWLDREKQDVELLQSLLVPYPAEQMRAYPVSPMVGNVKNDTELLTWLYA
ncbi:putative SOS response-associated peptidase YoqW [Collibacillus ludicampi]|uniref:Abasic site processing protein n=1 Tax=Collibacillus ludicampi TaxID=2771369 RepID=A0AAV4LBJ5_9BACL|nr:SOS response-associated peptidase [Collibacillus ludicampi]GIM45232.1 putative SOS response-associated peptidase YoqW [Collibacillus ludicampi]